MASELLLPDVNVLVSLAWPSHQFHNLATARLSDRSTRFATCAVTQLGFLRVSANPGSALGSCTIPEAAAMLKAFAADPGHIYLEGPQPAAMEDLWPLVMGSGQVTAAYLAGVARHHGAKLLTCEARLRGIGEDCVEVLAPRLLR